MKTKMFKKWLLLLAFPLACIGLSSTALSPKAHAQTVLSAQQLAAVNTVINILLLGEDTSASTMVGEFSNDAFSFSNRFNINFPQDGTQDIDVCFVIDSGGLIGVNDLVAILNQDDASPIALVEGENCITIDQASQLLSNSLSIVLNASGISINIDNIGVEPTQPSTYTLNTVNRRSWDERAVRKVLKIFAFGGHATTEQIVEWSNMPANLAIAQMLTFEEHNLLLSPLADGEAYPISASQYGTLTEWQDFMADENHIDNPIPPGNRSQYGHDGYNFDDAYNRMITVRGLNPFRQKIGFWETNYHLATNLDANVSRRQMTRYYDQIMQAHESGVPYYQVMGVAAKSAAVAMQYGHRNNYWNSVDQVCECNDDFAREIHQLFYGIFGADDPEYHENITIPETAKLLTYMPVEFINDFGFALDVNFINSNPGNAYVQHHVEDVEVLKNANDIPYMISGATAAEKIDALMPISMQHPESLENLPIMIVSVLADDNLSDPAKQQLRAAWADMGVNRVFLDFIRTYAISDLFHSPNQFKYLTSHERGLYIANKHNLDNLEAYFGGGYYNWDDSLYQNENAGRTVGSVISDDNAGDFFRPLHNVFGGQTSTEASDSALAFENHFNRLTDREHETREAVVCNTCSQGSAWEKKWPDVLPQRQDGNYYVSDVAEWLWMHAVGNMDNFTDLERAHVYSMLGAARIEGASTSEWNQIDDENQAWDFNLMMCVIADYKHENGLQSLDVSINHLLTDSRYNDYCRENDNGGDYEAHELAQLEAIYTGAQIAGNSEIQTVLNDLGNRVLPFNATQGLARDYDRDIFYDDGGARIRMHTRERVSYALNFIFTTPFIFAEGE